MERLKDILVLPAINAQIRRDLGQWRASPDNKYVVEQLRRHLEDGNRYAVEVSLRKDVLNAVALDDSFVSPGEALAYGREEGDRIVFSSAKKVRARISEISGRNYLFLEKSGRRIGYCRPKHISGIKLTNK